MTSFPTYVVTWRLYNPLPPGVSEKGSLRVDLADIESIVRILSKQLPGSIKIEARH